MKHTMQHDTSDLQERLMLGNRQICLTAAKQPFDVHRGERFTVYVWGQVRAYGQAELLSADQLATLVAQYDLFAHPTDRASHQRQAFYQQLAGQFAIVLWDQSTQRLALVNDHMGTVPFFYADASASAPTPLTTHLGPDLAELIEARVEAPVLSRQALFHYVYFHCIPAPLTIYEGVFKLTPAEWVDVSESGIVSQETLYRPHFSEKLDAPLAQKLTECFTALEKAVQVNLSETVGHQRDDETGTFLSGGLDSSTVAGLKKKLTGKARTFSIGFNEPGYDETPFAELSAKHFLTDHQTTYLVPEDISAHFVDIARAFQEPFGNSSALAVYHCAKTARQQGVKTLLAGDGGDELFAGNSRYAKQKWFQPFSQLPGFLQQGLSNPQLLQGLSKLPLLKKLGSYIQQAKNPLPDRLQSYNFLHRFAPEEVFTEAFLQGLDTELPIQHLRDRYHEAASEDDVNQMLYLDWKFTLADNDLVKVSTMCDLAGIDVRFPLVEKELVDFSCQIPASTKLPGFKLRHFFKTATSGFLAPETLDKSKHGFGLPFGRWMHTNPDLVTLTETALKDMKQRNIFKPEFIDKALAMHADQHAAYYGELVWIIAVLEFWLQSRTGVAHD